MLSPPAILAAFGLLLLAGLLIWWPRRGLAARIEAAGQLRRRALIEDALKHLFNCEYHGTPSSLESLSGALQIKRNHAAELLARLQALGYLANERSQWKLTEQGRRDALRIIRVHRLCERYLADHTGMDETDWHDEADRREHRLSHNEVEQLAADMGYPRFDPHGAPIPTAAGDIAPAQGQRLSTLAPGQSATITYIEDEPRGLYAELVAQRLAVGARIVVVDTSPEQIVLEVDSSRTTLSPIVAANVTVDEIAEPLEPAEPTDRLSDLRLGESGRVVSIAPALRGMQRRRLLDLGLVPGTVVRAELVGPGGDPTAYNIRGASIALRQHTAALVQVHKQADPV